LIQIIRRGASGIWFGESNGRTGNFKFINVEELETLPAADHSISESTLTGLLCRLDLAHLTSRLVLNGWDSLAKLKKLGRKDLVYLGINDKDEQDKLLTAVSVLQTGSDKVRTTSGRVDSGYYDVRDSESEDLDASAASNFGGSAASHLEGSTTSYFDGSAASFDSLPTSSSPGSASIQSKTFQTKSFLSDDCSSENSIPSEGTLKTRCVPASEPRKRFDSITESKLSIAEPNPQFNKSF